MQDLRQVRRLGNLKYFSWDNCEKLRTMFGPVARLGAKAAGKWFTGCRRNIVEVEVVGGGTRT